MRLIKRSPVLLVRLLVAFAATNALIAGPAGSALAAERPRLVVVLAVDQLRPDHLTRFRDLFLPARSGGNVGGFRWLMEEGAWHIDAHHDHLATETGPGHAALLTGAYPYKHGIIANSWYDRGMGKTRNCVEDPASPQVGVQREVRGASPSTLLVSTLGDELKMAEGARARVWSIAYKDRAAILMGGHLADGALWFDSESGAWVTSRFYAREGVLPEWVKAWNDLRKPHALFGKKWELSVPAEALGRLWEPGRGPVRDEDGLGKAFPHPLDGGGKEPGPDFFSAFITSPYANAYILETAEAIVRKEELGLDDVPDLLAVGLSTNDYAGHTFGPHSPEVLDVTVQADRQVAKFLAFLQSQVPGGLSRVTVVLTADHGVAPIVPGATAAGMPGGLIDEKALQTAVEAALDRELGEGDWIKAMAAGQIYLDLEKLAARGVARERAERIASEAAAAQPGIYVAWTRSDIEAGRLPRNDIGRRVAVSFHPLRSGDVVMVEAPLWTSSWASTGASHGTPYNYDTAVPILFGGAGITPGRYTMRVSTVDIAPTLAAILAIPAPSGSEGKILGHLLR